MPVLLRPGELDDLRAIAEGWGCPVGTAAWAIVAERLAAWRGTRLELGSLGAPLRAARVVLERAETERGCLPPTTGPAADPDDPEPAREGA